MTYTVVSTIVISLLALIWNSKDALNLTVKALLLAVGGWGMFNVLIELGYIIKL